MKYSYPLNINDLTINPENRAKRLGIEIDNKLSFQQRIFTLCNKASNQLNSIERIQKFMGFKEKEVLLNSFVYSNFNYCPLVWHFCSSKSLYIIEKIQNGYLDYYTTTSLVIMLNSSKKSGKATMEIIRLRCLALEIFKPADNLNPY